MKNFNWDEFMTDNVAIHCDIEEKANDFLRECHNRDMIWNDGDSLLEDNEWKVYIKNTCYSYDPDYGYNYKITFGSSSYYKKENYKIIEWEIEKEMKFNWSDFKQGKFVVKINNDNRQQFIKEIKEECKDIRNVNLWNYDDKYYCCDKNIINSLSISEINKPIINFILNANNKYEIHITSDGTTTNCVYKLNGKIVKKSNAKLNPVDKFDFKEGAKICIDRVFKDNIVKKGTKFRVLNTNKHNNGNYVCLDAYIGKIGTFDFDLNNVRKFLASGTFEKEYINAIDKENGKLIWHQSEVEILED